MGNKDTNNPPGYKQKTLANFLASALDMEDEISNSLPPADDVAISKNLAPQFIVWVTSTIDKRLNHPDPRSEAFNPERSRRGGIY